MSNFINDKNYCKKNEFLLNKNCEIKSLLVEIKFGNLDI